MSDEACQLFCNILATRTKELKNIKNQLDTIKMIIATCSQYLECGGIKYFSPSLVDQNRKLVKLINCARSILKRDKKCHTVGPIELRYFDCNCQSYGMLPINLEICCIPISSIDEDTIWNPEYEAMMCTIFYTWVEAGLDVFASIKECCDCEKTGGQIKSNGGGK